MTIALTPAGTLDMEFDPTTDSKQCQCPDGFGDGLPVRGFDPEEDNFDFDKWQFEKCSSVCRDLIRASVVKRMFYNMSAVTVPLVDLARTMDTRESTTYLSA